MEIDMKTWGGLKWNDANFACKYDKSIALMRKHFIAKKKEK